MTDGSSAKSLRKFIHRRIHKERAQPEHRAKLGLLEKHKDYKERSKAFHNKEDRIKALQRKAAGRNPDEFYFAMVKAKTNEKGVQVIDNEKKYTAAAMSKMKLEDQNYLQLKAVEESHQIQKLQANLQINQPNKGSSKHTLFLDSQDQVKKFNAVEHFDTVPELVNRPHNRTRKETLATQKVQGPTDDYSLKQVKRANEHSYKELAARTKRKTELESLVQRLQTQRNLMGKGTTRKLSTGENQPAQFKWKQERKR